MSLEFSPIDFNRQQEYLRLLQSSPCVSSDYSFINLWTWKGAFGLEWAWDHGLAWIRRTIPETVMWAPVGDWSGVDIGALVKKHLPSEVQFARIPDEQARIMEQSLGASAQIREDRDQWDYLYSIEDLTNLSGRKYHSKKNHLNRFKKENDFQYVAMDKSNALDALSLQEDWCQWRDCESDQSLASENSGIIRVLNNWGEFEGICGGMIYVGDALVAYSIGEVLTPDMLLVHFEKGSPDFRGSYQAINQQFLVYEGAGLSLVNREQDAGDPGLRKAKESYHPRDFIKKHIISIG